jgi:hypothetical protein
MSDQGLVDSIANGKVLMDLVEAVFADAGLAEARQAVRDELGDAAFVDACATIASFSAVVKIADGAGIPLEDYKEEASREIRDELSINAFVT